MAHVTKLLEVIKFKKQNRGVLGIKIGGFLLKKNKKSGAADRGREWLVVIIWYETVDDGIGQKYIPSSGD